ncbi:MAG: DUF1844 domain-containing protein [Phycisphaeraceae bacterium]|nr:DUF1844 domain-containing protein [Phycisphaeraceae bacterium]
MPNEQPPKIQVDSDWKAQAQAEKEKLAQKAQSSAGPGGAGAAKSTPGGRAGGGGGTPPADFTTLVSTMATQALLAMGLIADPRSGQRYLSLDVARHHIDMLGVIEQKTKGNLSEQEQELVSGTLYELRQHYIQVASTKRG